MLADLTYPGLLGQRLLQHGGGIYEYPIAERAYLGADPLLGDPLDICRVGLDGSARHGLDGEVEPGRDAHGSQQAQSILVESADGIAHGPHQPGLEITLPIGGIDHARGRVGTATTPGDGVDGQVAPGEVLEDVLAEGDRIRVVDGYTDDRDCRGKMGKVVQDGGALLRVKLDGENGRREIAPWHLVKINDE